MPAKRIYYPKMNQQTTHDWARNLILTIIDSLDNVYKTDKKHDFGSDDFNLLKLDITCCSEDPLQLQFLREFSSNSFTCHKTQLKVIQLPDKDIKHLNKNNLENIHGLENNLFGNRDSLILLIQGGCKRWKEMFCSYIESWIAFKDQEYQRSLITGNPCVMQIQLMQCQFMQHFN